MQDGDKKNDYKMRLEGENHTGKTNSSSGGDQLRGGDETYSNMYKGSSTASSQAGIGTENRRGSDNMIDDSDEDQDIKRDDNESDDKNRLM
jgi:hypothetical protein